MKKIWTNKQVRKIYIEINPMNTEMSLTDEVMLKKEHVETSQSRMFLLTTLWLCEVLMIFSKAWEVDAIQIASKFVINTMVRYHVGLTRRSLT